MEVKIEGHGIENRENGDDSMRVGEKGNLDFYKRSSGGVSNPD